MTLGRNDPCPCGSGKKYKKRCLNRATPQPAAASADVTEPRFFSPATSYYTHAALAEAMKPGGMVQIHPYVLIKLRSDPRLLESAAPSDRAHLRQLWQPSTVARMSDEEIEGRLGLLGVRYDRARFIEVARAHASAWAVADTWERDAHTLPGEDEDLNLSGDLAMLYFSLQRDAEAERCCQQLIHDHPDRATGYALLSDGLVRQAARHPDPAPDLHRAREWLERALAYPVKDADDFDLPAHV